MKCPHCGAELQENAHFCLYCMTSLGKKTELSPPTVKKRGRYAWLLAVPVLLLAIAGLLLLQAQHGAGAGTANSQTPNMDRPVSSTAEKTQEIPNPTQEKAHGEQTVGTQAVDVQPSETQPLDTPHSETQDPVESTDKKPELCQHVYLPASCIAPLTCMYCDAVSGSVAEEAHQWEDVTVSLYHEEVGHYEEVCVRCDKIVIYRCGYCSAEVSSFDELVAHFQSVHSGIDNYEWHLAHLDDMCDKFEEYVPVYETQWIVDQPAYTETVVSGKTCSLCGMEG